MYIYIYIGIYNPIQTFDRKSSHQDTSNPKRSAPNPVVPVPKQLNKKVQFRGKKKLQKKNIVIVNITPITLIIKRYAQGTFGGTGGTASSKSNPGGAKTPTAGGVKFPHTSFKPGIQS